MDTVSTLLGVFASCAPGTIYLTAGLTGLRRNELRQLRWADLRFDDESPAVTVRAETAKAKRQDTLALAPNVAQALQQWRQT